MSNEVERRRQANDLVAASRGGGYVARVMCSGTCGKRIDPTKPGVYRKIEGWEQVRGTGGANVIHDRHEIGPILCSSCYADMRAGGTIPLFR